MRALQIKTTLRALALGGTLAATAAAPAQFGLAGGIGEAFRPAFTTRDVQLAVDMLQLDDAQKFILETLYEDYSTEFRTGVDGFRDSVAAMRDQIDPINPDPSQIMRVVFGTIDVWRVESRQLADQVMDDLHGLLNREQIQMWDSYSRKLFRLKYLKNGQLPGEKLDLLNDVRDLSLDAVQTELLQPLLEEYEQGLDDALRRREKYLQKSQTELIEAIQSKNFGLGVKVAARQVELRKGVRDVNETYTRTIASTLPDDFGQTFLDKIRQRTYPRVYRRTPADRAFAAALKLEDLDPETLEAIADMRTAFIAELAIFNDRLVQMIREYKPQEIKYKVEQAAARLSGTTTERLEDPTRAEFANRNKISSRYMDQLKAILTPEQFASLPGARRWIEPDRDAIAAARARVTRAKSGNPSGAKKSLIGGPAGTAPASGSGLSDTEPNTVQRKKTTDD